ncbi:hypothetical protein NTE_00242 [Candidatus Nitrososphaera evergladensis SR1]|uniref:Uncharacterized protein n=1 Tax=Candidatus Nitrososphaera evergladensis SR1 TaxID=1459636 RepID=A0A075MSK0_9ARCH|nr:hypothetical protein [Candidatus Nitrososphaera evergladensis]AIF82324.1 hypothetical protein NTE_00242 [Candidatus Nitrososphaera evergladensis SR1]
MNIENEAGNIVIAKTYNSSTNNGRKVSYAFVDQAHALCLDKKDIIIAEIEACERLLKYAENESDQETVKNELSELKMALDLLT